MKIITVSDETRRLIDAHVQPGYDLRQTAARLPDGRWTIPVDDESIDKQFDWVKGKVTREQASRAANEPRKCVELTGAPTLAYRPSHPLESCFLIQ